MLKKIDKKTLHKIKCEKQKTNLLRLLSSVHQHICEIITGFINFVGRKIGYADLACNLMIGYCQAVENNSDCFITYECQRKEAKSITEKLYYKSKISEKICIVIQGPLQTKNNFTLETVRTYGKIFPGIQVIVSTWIGEDSETIEKLKNEPNCYVLQQPLPEYHGIGNINFQTQSSLTGSKYAKSIGKEYVFKQRSDIRVFSVGIFDWLYDTINQYPVPNHYSDKLNKRIIVFGAQLFTPYVVRDYVLFGNIDDMICFYDQIPMKDNPNTSLTQYYAYVKNFTMKDFYNNPIADNKLWYDYITRTFGKADLSLNTWWNLLKNICIVFDFHALHIIFYKYDYLHETNILEHSLLRNPICRNGNAFLLSELSYSMWRDMQNEDFYLKPEDYEYILDEPMRKTE